MVVLYDLLCIWSCRLVCDHISGQLWKNVPMQGWNRRRTDLQLCKFRASSEHNFLILELLHDSPMMKSLELGAQVCWAVAKVTGGKMIAKNSSGPSVERACAMQSIKVLSVQNPGSRFELGHISSMTRFSTRISPEGRRRIQAAG
jgi:hypothetical protein